LDGLLAYTVVLALLIFLSAFFSGSEAALFSLRRVQIARLSQQSAAGKEIANLLSAPRKILVTILIGNLVVNVFATSAATAVAVSLLGDKGVGVAFAVMSFLIMVFGEIFPKVLAIDRPRGFSLFAVYPLRLLHIVFYPVRAPIAKFTDTVVELFKKRLGMARGHFSTDELKTVLDVGRHEGPVGEFAFELVSNIIEFRETIVKEIMTPSIEVFSLPIGMRREDMEKQMIEAGFSRIPVYGETADDIRGVVHIKDVAAGAGFGSGFDINEILRSPYYVPETTKISMLFTELGRQRAHMALVIDEYGSYIGVVTLEDILEELVGEIRDAKESPVEDYKLMDDERIIVAGTMEIDDFNDVFDSDIADEESETIAGYVIGAIGEIPHEGETLDIGELRFHIISAQPNRIRKMRVEKL